MRRILPLLLTAVLAACSPSCSDVKAPPTKPGGLDVGDKAYEFKLMDAGRNWVKLSDVQPGWFLVVIFFRGSWCSACLTQMSELKQDFQKFLDLKAGVAFISNEPVADLVEFQRQWRFPFPLMSDPKLTVIDVYGARHVKGHGAEDISRPTVIIIDPARVVRYKYIGATPQDHPRNAEILDLVRKFKATPAATP